MAHAGWRREVFPAAGFVHLGGGSSEGFALASPHYLASIRRYYPHPRAAMAVVAMAAVISRIVLFLVISLGFRSPRMLGLQRGFDELLGRLRQA